MIKFTSTSSPEAVALTAACQIHNELLNDDCFAGYDGTKNQFDELYAELFIIAREEVSLEIEPVEQVVDTFYDYQTEIASGDRPFDWFQFH